jgi:hypothetical protein
MQTLIDVLRTARHLLEQALRLEHSRAQRTHARGIVCGALELEPPQQRSAAARLLLNTWPAARQRMIHDALGRGHDFPCEFSATRR